jgi:hypothetical protein
MGTRSEGPSRAHGESSWESLARLFEQECRADEIVSPDPELFAFLSSQEIERLREIFDGIEPERLALLSSICSIEELRRLAAAISSDRIPAFVSAVSRLHRIPRVGALQAAAQLASELRARLRRPEPPAPAALPVAPIQRDDSETRSILSFLRHENAALAARIERIFDSEPPAGPV